MPPKKKSAAPPPKKRQEASIDDGDGELEVAQDATLAVPPPPIPSEPSTPIHQSYTYASPVPSECSRIDPANPAIKVPCVLGVDEAGRGPVLGPLVYGIAYCSHSYQDALKSIGFADSKALTAERRDTLLSALIDDSAHLGWSVRVMSPQDISSGMLRRRPINLNAQSSAATVGLIQGVLDAGVDVTDIYVDTVGDPKSYAKLLSGHFPRHPHIKWTVTSKADAIYPIVGAASIAAKVTRDRCIEAWRYAEQRVTPPETGKEEIREKVLGDTTNHVKPPQQQGWLKRKAEAEAEAETESTSQIWDRMGPLGSGYPGDPNTVAFLKRTLDPVFGWPGIVRFSWATAKTTLEEKVKPPSATSSTVSTPTVPPTLGDKRLTRSLSRSSSFAADESSSAPVTEAESLSDTRPNSLYGTLLPQPAVPGGTASRGYKVKWIDEPVSISKFFGPTAGKKAAPKPSPANGATTSQSEGASALQTAINDWLKGEAAFRAKQSASTANLVDINVAKLTKDLGLNSADASFALS